MAESAHTKAFRAEHRRRHKAAPSAALVELEEARAAFHARRDSPEARDRFKDAQRAVAAERFGPRQRRELEDPPPEADPARVDLPDATVQMWRRP